MAELAQPGAFARYRPVVVADSLDDLRGPDRGVVTLPSRLDWGPNRSYDLADHRQRRRYYEIVLTETLDPADLRRFINGARLLAIWQDLNLADRVRARWEEHFPLLSG